MSGTDKFFAALYSASLMPNGNVTTLLIHGRKRPHKKTPPSGPEVAPTIFISKSSIQTSVITVIGSFIILILTYTSHHKLEN